MGLFDRAIAGDEPSGSITSSRCKTSSASKLMTYCHYVDP
jgi:hypothetical protein